MTHGDVVRNMSDDLLAALFAGIEQGTEERIQQQLFNKGIEVDIVKIPALAMKHWISYLEMEVDDEEETSDDNI